MSDEQTDKPRWQVPMPTKKDGWYNVPLWVVQGDAVPYPRNKYTLKDGAVVSGGTWLTTNAEGQTIVDPQPLKSVG